MRVLHRTLLATPKTGVRDFAFRATGLPASSGGVSGSRKRAGLLVAAGVVAVMHETAPVRAAEPDWVCPPGHEKFFLDALSGGTPIAGCRLEKASIVKNHVVADYRCAAGQVAVELHPPDAKGPAAARTAKFRLVSRGVAPPPLIEGLRERILRREAAFAWIEASKAVPVRGSGPEPGGANGILSQRGRALALAIVLAMMSLGGLWLLFSRRARRAPGTPGERRHSHTDR